MYNLLLSDAGIERARRLKTSDRARLERARRLTCEATTATRSSAFFCFAPRPTPAGPSCESCGRPGLRVRHCTVPAQCPQCTVPAPSSLANPGNTQSSRLYATITIPNTTSTLPAPSRPPLSPALPPLLLATTSAPTATPTTTTPCRHDCDCQLPAIARYSSLVLLPTHCHSLQPLLTTPDCNEDQYDNYHTRCYNYCHDDCCMYDGGEVNCWRGTDLWARLGTRLVLVYIPIFIVIIIIIVTTIPVYPRFGLQRRAGIPRLLKPRLLKASHTKKRARSTRLARSPSTESRCNKLLVCVCVCVCVRLSVR